MQPYEDALSRSLHITLFLSLASIVFGVWHFYIFSRLSDYFELNSHSRRYLAIGLGALLIILMAAMPLGRILPRETASPFVWVAFTWLGIAMILGLTLLGCDIAKIVMSLAVSEPSPERRLFLQKGLGLTALGSAALVSAASLWNGLRPVQVKRVDVHLAKLPPARGGFRIAQITDLHIGPMINGEWLKHVVERTNALNPDIIAITGDLVDGSVADLSPHVEPLRALQAKHGVFFITGNHEYYSGVDEWIEHIESLGIRVLRNERVTIQNDDNDSLIELAGVDDWASASFPGHGPDLPKALEGRNTEIPTVLLAHQPAAIREAATLGVDLQLSGHTHGGQIWPWNYFVYIQQPYVSGLHRYPNSNSQIYVSEGTGFWGPPMRLGTSAEITEIVLMPVIT